jgi:hypothetical protein
MADSPLFVFEQNNSGNYIQDTFLVRAVQAPLWDLDVAIDAH